MSGEGGIRTPGTLRYVGFQDRCIRPLCHLSEDSAAVDSSEFTSQRTDRQADGSGDGCTDGCTDGCCQSGKTGRPSPDLDRLIELWPALPVSVQQAISALADSGNPRTSDDERTRLLAEWCQPWFWWSAWLLVPLLRRPQRWGWPNSTVGRKLYFLSKNPLRTVSPIEILSIAVDQFDGGRSTPRVSRFLSIASCNACIVSSGGVCLMRRWSSHHNTVPFESTR